MKILVLGANPGNFFNPIAQHLLKKGHSIDILMLGIAKVISDDDSKYYQHIFKPQSEKNYFTKIMYTLLGILNPSKWQIFKMLVLDKEIMEAFRYLRYGFPPSFFKKYNVINIQAMNNPKFLNYCLDNIKVVGSFWGSELLSSNDELDKRISILVDKCTAITLQNKVMMAAFNKKFLGNESKVNMILFPLNQKYFKLLEQASLDKSTNDNLINIAVGYNGNPSFRHVEVIDIIGNMHPSIKEKIKITINLAYGRKEDYHQIIEEKLRHHKLNFYINMDRYHWEDLAKIRCSTDILISIPYTDGFSATVSEVLFCENILITGSWLPYDIYRENGVHFYSIESTRDISSVLTKIIQNIDNEKKMCHGNQQKVMKVIDFDTNLEKWEEILTKM